MKSSPWGAVQQSYQIEPGVSWVSTASHGGLMVARAVGEKMLSMQARICAFTHGDYFCFEEDCDYAIAFYDVPTWAHIMAAKDAAEWKPLVGQMGYGMTAAEIQKRYDETIAWAHETDDQTRERYRLVVMRYNPEYFGLGGCERRLVGNTFGLSCVQRDVVPAEMCEPCKRTHAEIERVKASEKAA